MLVTSLSPVLSPVAGVLRGATFCWVSELGFKVCRDILELPDFSKDDCNLLEASETALAWFCFECESHDLHFQTCSYWYHLSARQAPDTLNQTLRI